MNATLARLSAVHKFTDEPRPVAIILIFVGGAKIPFVRAVVMVMVILVSNRLLLAQRFNGSAASKLVRKRQEKMQLVGMWFDECDCQFSCPPPKKNKYISPR